MRFLFWIFIVAALTACAAFAAQAYIGAPTGWYAPVWPLLAIAWAALAEAYRRRTF